MLNDRTAGWSARVLRYESAMETADSGSGVGGLEAAGRIGYAESSTAPIVAASSIDNRARDFLGGVGGLHATLLLLHGYIQVSSFSSEAMLSVK